MREEAARVRGWARQDVGLGASTAGAAFTAGCGVSAPAMPKRGSELLVAAPSDSGQSGTD
jgi:hypothetical protein